MKIKLNVDLGGFIAGQEIKLDAINGIPKDPFWRARIKDADRDNCITILKSKSKKESK